MRLLVMIASLSILAVAQQAGATDCSSCLGDFCDERAEARRGVFFAELVKTPDRIDEGYTMRVFRIEGDVDVSMDDEFEVGRPRYEARVGDTYLFSTLLRDGTRAARPHEAMPFFVDGDELDCGISVKRAIATALSSSCMDDVHADVQACIDGLGHPIGPNCSSARGTASEFGLALAALGVAALRRQSRPR